MLGHTKGWLGQSVGHLELARRLESFCAGMVHGVVLPSTCEVSQRKRFQKPPESAEFLDFVIKRRSANHSWRPNSKAAPKKERRNCYLVSVTRSQGLKVSSALPWLHDRAISLAGTQIFRMPCLIRLQLFCVTISLFFQWHTYEDSKTHVARMRGRWHFFDNLQLLRKLKFGVYHEARQSSCVYY